MTRQHASELRLVKYTGGPTCKHGHSGERYVSTNACVLCSSEHTRTPFSEWTEEYKQHRYDVMRDRRHRLTKERKASKNKSAIELMKSLGLDLPTTRAAAAESGSLHYFTGKPCIKGHIAKRATTGGCHECALAFAARNKNANLKPTLTRLGRMIASGTRLTQAELRKSGRDIEAGIAR